MPNEPRWRAPRTLAAALALTVAVGLAGCDDDEGTGPGSEQGTVEAAVTDDPGAGSQALRAAASDRGAAEVDGTFDASARVEVSADGSTWVELEEAQQVQVALQNAQATTVSSAEVAARSYARVRLVLEGASADVAAGSTIGGGALETSVTVQLEGGEDDRVVLEFDQPVAVSADADTRVTFDLNSHLWLDETAVQTGTVSEAAVQSAAEVTVE